MSETTSTAATTETEKVSPAKEAPVALAEKPLNVDILTTSTARFTRGAWNVFLSIREDLQAVRFKRYRIELESKTPAGCALLKALLEAVDVTAIKTEAPKKLAFISSFEKLQTVMRHPETLMVDLSPAE